MKYVHPHFAPPNQGVIGRLGLKGTGGGRSCVVIPLRDPRAGAKEMAHKALDDAMNKLFAQLDEQESPKMHEMSTALFQKRSEILSPILQGMVQSVAESLENQNTADCPKCGHTLGYKRKDTKKFSTLHGEIKVTRPYFYCKKCKLGQHPLDEALGLTEKCHQLDIEAKFSLLSARLPFEEAAGLFKEFTGISASDHFGHESLNQISEVANLETVIPKKAQIEEKIKEVQGSCKEKPILVVASDGAHAPTRPKGGRKKKRGSGKWREVKGFRIYLMGSKERIEHLVSWHQIEDAEAFGNDLAYMASQIPREKVRVVLLGDGAKWLWTTMEAHFPGAKSILDWYHCAENVHKVVEAQFGKGSEGEEWASEILTRIKRGWLQGVIKTLIEMTPRTHNANDKIQNLIEYFKYHRDRMDYSGAKKEGLPYGSGGIESANKFISHKRLKLSGAWWLEGNGNNMLRIRCALYNGTFPEVLKNYLTLKMGGH